MFEQTSIENFYHYLIFQKFASASSDKKTTFLANLVQRTLRGSNIFNTLMETQTIDQARNALNEVSENTSISKNPLDLYCSESDPETAFYLLRFLMFTTMDKEQYTAFKTTYARLGSEEKKMYLPTNIWNAEFL
jgi:hypothetical protein